MITHLRLLSIFTFPQVSLSIGHIESGMCASAVGRCGERGAFQVIPKHWGRVPKTLRRQMDQHNRVLVDLHRECGGDLLAAVVRYNGRGKKARGYLGLVTHDILEREILGRE